MSDDFRDLNLDKLTRRELKTPEQIAKHTVEGYLETRIVDRALHLLTVGDELQKISVMKNLPMLIKEDLTACIQRIVPRMQQTLPHGTTEYNMGACDAVRTVARQNLMSTDNFTKVFLQHILNSLESRDTVAADEWLNVLLDIIKVLPVNVLHTEVLPIAVNKAHISKPVPVRVTSCRILGHLALSFAAAQVKRDIIPVVISLCQDVSGEVRAAMSKELPNLASTLGLETSNFLLNHLLDLVSDEEAMVREAAVEAVAHMLPKFPPDILKSTIIPLTKKVFPEIVKNEDRLLVVLTKVYGQYAIGLKNYMTVIEKSQFLQRYIQMSQLNSNSRRNKINPYNPIVMDEDELALRLTDCRLNCAYNFPAMVLFSQDLKQELIDALISVMRNLASDSFCQVRKKIASGFYEVMKLMPKWQGVLKVEFIRLLKDDIDIVMEGLVPNVSDILLSLSSSNTLTSDKVESGKDVGQALFVCEKNLNDAPHWRLQEELLAGFRVVPRVFHPEFVYLYFVPLLVTRAVSGRILPCRVAALNTLLVIIADPSQAKQKLKIRNKVLELCNNSSFHCRQLFLRGMSTLITQSPEVVKELFFHNITSMAEDKVPNIRLMLCKLLPRLKTIALDPVDRKLLASIDAATTSMSGETDRDVQMQLKIALNLMDEGDKAKVLGSKRLEPDGENSSLHQKSNAMGFSNTISPLTDMRSFTSDSSARSISSQYTMATQQQQTLSSRPKPYTGAQTTRAQSMPATTTGSPRNQVPSRISQQKPGAQTTRAQSMPATTTGSPRNQLPSRISQQKSGIKAPGEKRKTSLPRLVMDDPDEFLVDAGIPLKSATEVVKRIPTPRPVHRSLLLSDLEESNSEHKASTRTLPALTTSRPTLINKNINFNYRPSSLPVKKANFKPLTNEEIEKELLLPEKEIMSDSIHPYSPRTSDRLKYSARTTRTSKKENKRYSMDVGVISNIGHETRSGNVNKRYSLDVDVKKDVGNKKSMSCINNNTLMSPKLGSTRSGIVRPQSCVLETEKVNHSKRSMSVENLPPKVTRLASRLPVRATDPKPSKPK